VKILKIYKRYAVDPLWEKYRSLNTYQYAANNPIVAIDKGGDSVSVLISCPAFLNFEGETGSNGLVGHVALNIDGAIYSIFILKFANNDF
jgi:hypothetical protein